VTLLTEKEAAGRWCPFARVPVAFAEGWMQEDQVVGASANRENHYTNDNVQRGSRCIGSLCMAWRTERKPGKISELTGRGYCGLAGALR